jgi:hypothetical protein
LAVLQQLFYERIARQQIANSNNVNLSKKFPLRGLIKGVRSKPSLVGVVKI